VIVVGGGHAVPEAALLLLDVGENIYVDAKT